MISKQFKLHTWMPDLLCVCTHRFGVHNASSYYRCLRCGRTNCKVFELDELDFIRKCDEWKKNGLWKQYEAQIKEFLNEEAS